MSLLTNFDTDINFWDTNPQLKVIDPFKELHDGDKSRNRGYSSRLMWTIALVWDRSSKYYNLPENGIDGKINLVFTDHFGDASYYDKNTDKVNILKNFYLRLSETVALRELRTIEEKLIERGEFLKNTKYDIGKETERGYVLGTVDILDKMFANTKKLWDLYEQALKQVLQEQDAGRTAGGGEMSATDRGTI